MNCDGLQDYYELYALGLAETPEANEIDAHLKRQCPRCTAGLVRAQVLNTGLALTVPEHEPPKRLRRRVLASVGATEPSWRAWVPWGALAASLLIGLAYLGQERERFGGELAAVRAELQQSQADLTRTNAALRLLNEPETREVQSPTGAGQPPRGRVFVNARRGVVLLAGNLPPIPAGRVYEMWLLPKGQAPVASGTFRADANGNALQVREGAVNVANLQAVAVSVEPVGGSPAPTTKPLLVIGL